MTFRPRFFIFPRFFIKLYLFYAREVIEFPTALNLVRNAQISPFLEIAKSRIAGASCTVPVLGPRSSPEQAPMSYVE